MVRYIKLGENSEPIEYREVRQGELTSDCWLVQFRGLVACHGCPVFLKPDCGGGKTLLKIIEKEVLRRYGDLRVKFSIVEQMAFQEALEHNLTFHEILNYEWSYQYFTFSANTLKKVYKDLVRVAVKENEREYRKAKGVFVPLDELHPYLKEKEKATSIERESWHKPVWCDCEKETGKGAYRDVLLTCDGYTLAYYHQHCIVKREKSKITLDSAGYRTPTTKERMNRHLRDVAQVYQHNYEWFIGYGDTIEKFYDGIEIQV